MAHHHHPQDLARHGSVTVTRPLLLRALSTMSLILPAIFYLLAMAFTLATIYNPSFAVSNPRQDSQGPYYNVTYKTSPFFVCNASDNQALPNFAGYYDECRQLGGSALGSKGIDECRVAFTDFAAICSRRVLSAELIVAGAVLSGLAIIAAVAATALGWTKATSATTTVSMGGTSAEMTGLMSSMDEGEAKLEGEDLKATGSRAAGNNNSTTSISTVSIALPFTIALATVLALVAAVLIAVAQSVAYTALVTMAYPRIADSENAQTHWYLGQAGQVFTTLSYAFAALGVFVTVTKLGVRGM